MSFIVGPLGGVVTGVAAASERFWGLGEVGLAVVIFITVFLVIVVAWLIHNTGRWD
ncbi:MAG: hypothetical protein JXA58_07395 [Dehalococcoidia bacterium]|nr:hypothetical protein [Dehalococcoidia bacterium]